MLFAVLLKTGHAINPGLRSLCTRVEKKKYCCEVHPHLCTHAQKSLVGVKAETSDGPHCRVLNVTETKCQQVERVMIKAFMQEWKTGAWDVLICFWPQHHTVLYGQEHKRLASLQTDHHQWPGWRWARARQKKISAHSRLCYAGIRL